MKIEITQEKRGEIENIQRGFRGKLSPREIKRGTAQGINSALSKSIPKINKAIKAEYNITQKYLSRMAVVSPKANSASLWGGIRINENRLPMIAFRPKQQGSSIAVSIHKGKNKIIRNSFITTMSSGHTGVFARGKYEGNKFIYGKFKPIRSKTKGYRTTELLTTSSFKMGVSRNVASEVQDFMGTEVSARVEGILRSRVEKLGSSHR